MKIEKLPYLGVFAEVRRDTATGEWVEHRFHVRTSDKFALMDDQEAFISAGLHDERGDTSQAKSKASSLRHSAQ